MTRPWVDRAVYGIADPVAALADAKAAHRYFSRELAGIGPNQPIREWNLREESKRLADIAWKLHRLKAGAA